MLRHVFYVIAERINGFVLDLFVEVNSLTRWMYFFPSRFSLHRLTRSPSVLSGFNSSKSIFRRMCLSNPIRDYAVRFNWHSLITGRDVLSRMCVIVLGGRVCTRREDFTTGDASVKTGRRDTDIDSPTLRTKLNYTTPSPSPCGAFP